MKGSLATQALLIMPHHATESEIDNGAARSATWEGKRVRIACATRRELRTQPMSNSGINSGEAERGTVCHLLSIFADDTAVRVVVRAEGALHVRASNAGGTKNSV